MPSLSESVSRNSGVLSPSVSIGGQDQNGWVIAQNVPTQYDLYDILAYTQTHNGKSIGEGKTISPNAYVSNNSPQPPPQSLTLRNAWVHLRK